QCISPTPSSRTKTALGVLTPSCVLVSAPTAKVTAVRLRSRTCARLRMTVLPGRILEESNSGGRKVKVDAPRRAVTLDEVRAQRDEVVQLGRRCGVRNIRASG